MSQILQLEPEPLTKWVTNVVEKGRELGHTDNEIKSWVKKYAKLQNYPSSEISKALRKNGIRVYNRSPVIYRNYPKLVICPRCVTVGKINVHYPNGRTVYVIRHELIDGTWGRVAKIRRCRRCYISDVGGRQHIRHTLDLYEERDRQDLKGANCF